VSGPTISKRIAGSRFLRFAVVGAGGFLVDSTVLFLAHHAAGLDPYLARAISIFAAMNFTWFGNRELTFRAHAATGPREMLAEWSRFILTNAVGALVNYGVYAAIVRFAPPPLNNIYAALVAGVAAGLVFNFTLSRKFVFREPPVL
jgi:putative flippase GtrA